MLLLFYESGNLAEDFETRTFRRTLQRICRKEWDNNLLYIPLRAYGVAITLTVISALLLLEVDLAAPYRIFHFLEQFSITFLHLQMKVQLDTIPRSISRRLSYIDVETALAVRKADNIFVANCRYSPSHTASITYRMVLRHS